MFDPRPHILYYCAGRSTVYLFDRSHGISKAKENAHLGKQQVDVEEVNNDEEVDEEKYEEEGHFEYESEWLGGGGVESEREVPEVKEVHGTKGGVPTMGDSEEESGDEEEPCAFEANLQRGSAFGILIGRHDGMMDRIDVDTTDKLNGVSIPGVGWTMFL
jgi:hypothetical protein